MARLSFWKDRRIGRGRGGGVSAQGDAIVMNPLGGMCTTQRFELIVVSRSAGDHGWAVTGSRHAGRGQGQGAMTGNDVMDLSHT